MILLTAESSCTAENIYNPKTNISSSNLLNNTVTTVHCQEMLFPVQISDDRFYSGWYGAGKATHNDPLY